MSEVLLFALEELDKYYKKLTGQKCTNIRLIEDASILNEGEDAYFVEAYSVQVDKGRGEIRGSNGRSVLMGIYRFLRELGCVFFHPGAGGEVIPSLTEDACTVHLTHRPFYPFRAITMEGGTSVETVLKLIAKMKEDFHQMIRLYYGEDVKEEEAAALCEVIAEKYPDCDVDFHNGGQSVYYYVLSLE